MAPPLDERNARVFGEALDVLTEAGCRYMVGGAFAMYHYAGIWRDTKDLDVFTTREDGLRALDVLARAGFATHVEEAHWLGKAVKDERLVDVIWGGGNWATFVDPGWLVRSRPGHIMGRHVWVCAPEDIILSKAYVAGRERYDGTDIAHLIHSCGRRFDWDDLVDRFGPHFSLLLQYLVLYRFVYPEERDIVPSRLIQRLAARIGTEDEVADGLRFRGPLVDRYGYFHDLDVAGQPDPRYEMARRAGCDLDAVTLRRDLDREMLDSGRVYLPADTSSPAR